MRVIVAGSRDRFDYEVVVDAIEAAPFPITTLLCGMARGVDMYGFIWAKKKGIPIREYPADWERWGKAAGAIRNQLMAQKADALIAVWDGRSRGTADMIDKMRRLQKPVFVREVSSGA